MTVKQLEKQLKELQKQVEIGEAKYKGLIQHEVSKIDSLLDAVCMIEELDPDNDCSIDYLRAIGTHAGINCKSRWGLVNSYTMQKLESAAIDTGFKDSAQADVVNYFADTFGWEVVAVNPDVCPKYMCYPIDNVDDALQTISNLDGNFESDRFSLFAVAYQIGKFTDPEESKTTLQQLLNMSEYVGFDLSDVQDTINSYLMRGMAVRSLRKRGEK